MKTNDVLQWAGTACFMVMYTVMSFHEDLNMTAHETVQLIAGCLGGALFLVWSIRVANKQQQIVNVVGVTITLIGLYKYLA